MGVRRSVTGLGLVAAIALWSLWAIAPSASARSDLAEIAFVNRRSEAQVRRILADPTSRVDQRKHIYHVDPAPQAAAMPGGAEVAAGFPYEQTFLLHSRPGSNRVIYLDFDGHTISGTAWNNSFGVGPFFAEGFSLDADPAFSNAEQDIVQSVWQRMAEDYAIFDVDVTTQDPGQAAITRSDSSDQAFGTRALLTNTRTLADACGCGGMAYVGVFNQPSQEYYQPAFIFPRALGSDAKNMAEAAAHEVGHNLGLLHDGTATSSYYTGHGAWAPIMGVAYGKPIAQWSKGEYAFADNQEDDIAVIQSYGAPFLPDDNGDTAAAATQLPPGPTVNAAGIITTDADIDVFRVRAASGAATFSVSPAAVSPNLDARLELRNAAGVAVAIADPPSAFVDRDTATGLGASISASLVPGGDYFLFVTGVGTGNPSTGYSGYASLGRYSLTGTLQEPAATSLTLSSSANPSTAGQNVTFTATVSVPPPGSATSASPTGTVAFKDGATVLCGAAALGAGQTATCTSSLGVGSLPITAAYGGDGEFQAAPTASLTQSVLGAAAAATVTSSVNPSVSGQQVTFGATVTRQGAGPATPTGAVTFNDGTAAICSGAVLSAGQATCVASPLAGSHSITAVYSGDASFSGTTSPPLTQAVGLASTTVALTSSSTPAVADAALTLTATVSVTSPGGGPVTGSVTFKDGSTVICTSAVAAGAATCAPSLAAGSYSLTAVYGGSSQHGTSTSAALSQVVLPPGSTFLPVTPKRLLDTRTGIGGPAVAVGAGATREPVVAGGTTGIPANATAVVLNMAVTAPTASSYLSVYPSGVARPDASNLTFSPGQTISNLAVVGVGTAGKISIFNYAGTTQVIADIVGYYLPTGGSTFLPVTPKRLLDTRIGIGGPAVAVGAGATRELVVAGGTTGIPANATAVVLNMAVTAPTASSYLSVYPSGVARPDASNLTFSPGLTISNLAVVGVGTAGKISIFNYAGTTQVIADIVGFTI